MTEFSKTVRFDFPRIPIIGTLLLMISLINYPDLYTFLNDDKGKISIGVVTAIIVALGVAGICVTQLFSIAFFDFLFPIKRRIIENKENFKSSYEWFAHIQDEATLIDRKVHRAGDHDIDDRNCIKGVSHKQAHATLHALEMECREKSPAFGMQLEYYYSLYIFFITSAIFAAFMLLISSTSNWTEEYYAISVTSMVVDFIIVFLGVMGALRAREMKEYLRVTLFNHDRSFVLELLSKWFHCSFGTNKSANKVD